MQRVLKSMFGLFRSKNKYEQDAKAVYLRIMERLKAPVFYTDFGVPDSFDGRFEVQVLHAFIVIEGLWQAQMADQDTMAGRDLSLFNQALFDCIFKEMKMTLREIGVGDVGIPKHMQKMMKAFNGRMHVYDEAFKAHNVDAALDDALSRNVYGTVDEEIDQERVKILSRYVMNNVRHVSSLGFSACVEGNDLFLSAEGEKHYD